MKRLEIGPGPNKLGPDWITLDCVPGPHIVFVANWGEDRLPFNDETFDLVYGSHVLEHVPWFRTIDALREVHRILKPCAPLEIWVPNFAVIVSAYLDGEPADNWRKHNDDGDVMTWVNGRLFTYGPDPNWHRACFDERHLRRCFEAAGFREVHRLTGRERGHAHGPISLGMRGVK
jgi:predicted SAM-dependent methyltransferase